MTRENSGWIRKLDMTDIWQNSAYDENGDSAVCDFCGADLRWRPQDHVWYCPDCGQVMNRTLYFDHIGANPPGDGCLLDCDQNYPFCKKDCLRYPIDPNDPML